MNHFGGVDIGTESVKFACIRPVRGGTVPFEVTSAGVLNLRESALLPDDDPRKEALIAQKFRSFLSGKKARPEEWISNIPAQATMMRYLQLPVVSQNRLEKMVGFEAEEQSSRGESLCFDYALLTAPSEVEHYIVLLGFAREKAVLNRIKFLADIGIRSPDVDFNELGLFNAYVHGQGPGNERIVVLLDIGERSTHVVVVVEGRLASARSLSGGGNRFTDAVAAALQTDRRTARRKKERLGSVAAVPGESPPEGDEAQTIRAVLTREADTLVRNIQSSLMYCRSQVKVPNFKVDKVFLSGGGARLKGLKELLARRLGTGVKPLEPLRNVSLGDLSREDVDALSRESDKLSIAVGLALSRAAEDGVAFSVLPGAAKKRRAFLKQGIYSRYAVVALVLALVLAVYTGHRNYAFEASAAEENTRALSTAEASHRVFRKIDTRNVRLRHELAALKSRVYSGRDLLRIFSQLKKRTPQNVWLDRAGTSPPAEVAETELVKGDAEAQTFQTRRVIYLTGWARSDVSDSEALGAATGFAQKLTQLDSLFRDAKCIWNQPRIDTRDGYFFKKFIIKLDIVGELDVQGETAPGRKTATRL